MKMLSRRSILLAGAALAGLAVAPALAQEAAAPADPAELLKPPTLGDMALGADEGASKVTIVEYASATCPHCAAFHKDVWPKLKAEYIDTKKIRFIFREFPLNDPALAAFMIARAAPKESYFPLIDVYFDTLESWAQDPAKGLLNIAKQAGFTQEKFDATLRDEKLAKGIMEIRDGGVKFGVKGTPTFFINGQPLEGEVTYDNMKTEIDKQL
jgi:protein-disulfide isomerase